MDGKMLQFSIDIDNLTFSELPFENQEITFQIEKSKFAIIFIGSVIENLISC